MLQALTKSNAIIAEINQRLGIARAYATKDDLAVRRAETEARKILKANPAEGHNVLAQISGYLGDYKNAVHHLDVALNLTHNDPILLGNKTAILLNLGFFSEAQDSFAAGTTPELGQFTNNWNHGFGCGAFHILDAFIQKAKVMQLDLSGVNCNLVSRIVRFMDANTISDKNIAAMLDVAGELLRERNLFFVGIGPECFLWDQDEIEQHLLLTIRAPLAVKPANELDSELGHRLFERIRDAPFSVMVHFESGLPSDERFTERTLSAV